MKTTMAAAAAVLVALFLSAGCVRQGGSAHGQAATGVAAEHPQLSQVEMQKPCFECHKEVTPDLYDQWYNSGHGLDNVRCFQCHGTFENMKRVPDEAVCSVCHSGQFHKRPAGSSCWQCHPAHAFSAHK